MSSSSNGTTTLHIKQGALMSGVPDSIAALGAVVENLAKSASLVYTISPENAKSLASKADMLGNLVNLLVYGAVVQVTMDENSEEPTDNDTIH